MSPNLRRVAGFGSAVLVLSGLGQFSAPALACGGPCAEADVWSASLVGDELYVVTNFGLLRSTGNGWHLDCEELFGGLLTHAAFSAQAQLASTSVGFYRGTEDSCTWESSSEGASNTWFLDFALLEGPIDDAGVGAAVVALVIDRETSESKVEVAALGGPFETLATFSSTSGLRKIVAGGSPARVYTTGYTFSPRTWHVLTAEFGTTSFSERQFDAETDTTELRPLAVDPLDSGRLWIRAVATTQDPDALLLLDAGDTTPRQVLRLNDEEKLADLAFSPDRVFAVGRGAGVSTLYSSASGEAEFSQFTTVNANLTCLAITERGFLACNSDFTRESPWIVAMSEDEGQSWQPELSLDDLGRLSSCGEVCATTTGWLYGLFGTDPGEATTTGERNFADSGLVDLEPEPEDQENRMRRSPADASDGGCRVARGRQLRLGVWFAILLFAGYLRRARHARSAR